MTLSVRALQRIHFAILAVIGGAAFVVAVVLAAGPAGAQVVIDLPAGPDISVTPLVVQLLVAFVQPVLTGIVTRVGTSDGVKAAVTFVCLAVSSVITSIAAAPSFDLRTVVIVFVGSLVVNAASWLQVWQPAGGAHGAPLAARFAGFIGTPSRSRSMRYTPG